MKTILVTGGAGFIGSHLCERLLNEGNAVVCLDNLSTGSHDNIGHLADNRSFLFIHGEVEDCMNHTGALNLDQIYHLACPASPKAYQDNPRKTLNTCYIGTLAVLNLAEIKKCKVLFTSTSEVYGDPLVHPQPEDYFGNVNTIGDRSCYDEGKRIAETLCYESNKLNPVSIVRLFNTFGPRLAAGDGRVVSNFIVAAIKGLPLTVYGSGKQTRSLCYVDDTVDALIKVMDEGEFGPYNIGTEYEITVKQLAEWVISLVNRELYPSNIGYLDLPQDDPKQRRPVLNRIFNLGWRPETSIENGLLKTIQYFRYERT